MNTFWRQPQVEDLALITLLDFRRRTGLPLAPPIDVDLVGEIVCDLRWDWGVLREPPHTIIWAGLFPEERRVVLNEAHKTQFARKSGLERFTKAHEIGHWMLHVNAPSPRRHDLWCRGEAHHACDDVPEAWIERHADWFAAALLMPANIFVPIAEERDLGDWKVLYELAATFDVSISALCVRLAQLKLGFVDANGRLHARRHFA